MKSFLKLVLATMVGIVLSFFLLFSIFAGMGSGSSAPKVSSNSVLKLSLSGELPDLSNDDPFSRIDPLSGSFDTDPIVGLNELKEVLRHAAKDDKIKAILLNTDNLYAMPANMHELRRALLKFKESGKLVYAYSNGLSEQSILLNAVADKSYLNPLAYVDFNGISSEITYFTGLLEKLKIRPMIFYAGEFKSATEPFRLKSMSDENRLQVEAYLDGIYRNYLKEVSASRKVPVDSLKQLANNLSVFFAEDAVKYGLVDALKYEDEVEAELKAKFGYEEDARLNVVGYKDYKATVKPESEGKSKNKIAVIYAEGDILDGSGSTGNIYGETYAKMIRKVRNDKDVKAIVLRVNSPGGSAFASEQILRELQLAQKKIPVVVSMGNLAASGGYYISSSANKIVAEPTTITGSIGVFGMMFNVEEALNSNLGLTFDRVKTAQYADFGSATRPWDDKEKELVTASVKRVYHIFLKHVSEGRKMSIEEVDKIARGRVWVGEDAHKLGLVDTLGSLNTAIAEAKKLADIETYALVSYPEAKSAIDIILDKISGKKDDEVDNAMTKVFGEDYQYIRQVMEMKNKTGIQARIPYIITFR